MLSNRQFDRIVFLVDQKKSILHEVDVFNSWCNTEMFISFSGCNDIHNGQSVPFKVDRLYAGSIAINFIEGCKYRIKKIDKELEKVEIKE